MEKREGLGGAGADGVGFGIWLPREQWTNSQMAPLLRGNLVAKNSFQEMEKKNLVFQSIQCSYSILNLMLLRIG